MKKIRSRAEALEIELDQILKGGRGKDLQFRIFGHIDGHYSLSAVNRGLAVGLNYGPGSVLINHYHGAPVDGVPVDMGVDQAELIASMIQRWNDESDLDAERISICQHYPLTMDSRQARLKIAFFFWEESVVPRGFVEHFNKNFAAVLVGSEFVRKVLRDSGCRLPIKVVPLGIDHLVEADPVEIVDLRPDAHRRFRFLHISSAFPRKGIDILLEAYNAEFSGSDAVELVIKTFANEHNDLHVQIDALRRTRDNPPRILLDEQRRSEGELAWLYSTADAVVLPTRGEGFNLPAAEAMALGRPVIATAYSGQADFLTDDTGWCLPFDFAPSRTHLTTEGSLWLEPRTDDLRQILHRFFAPETRAEVAAEAAVRSKVGERLVRSVYRWSQAGALIRHYAYDLLEASRQERPDAIRLAVVSSWDIPCGIAEYTRILLGGLDRQRFAFTYFCETRSAAAAGVHPLFSLGIRDSFAGCCDVIAARHFDAIVVQHQQSLFDIFAAAPHLARLQKQAPVFLTLHATQFLSEADIGLLASLAEALAHLERIVVHTISDQRLLKNIGLIHNVVIVPHGIGSPNADFLALSPAQRRAALIKQSGLGQGLTVLDSRPELRQQLTTGTFWIGTFGFLLPHKGIREIVEAVRHLHDSGLTHVRALLLCATLDVRSEVLSDEIESLIVDLGLRDAVTLVRDFLAMADGSTLLGAMDINVFAYQQTGESASGAVRSAAATGRPILTTPQPIFKELSPFAFTTDGTDAQSLALSLSALITNPDLLNSQQDSQAQWIEARNWRWISERYANIIEGVVAENRVLIPAVMPPAPTPSPASEIALSTDLEAAPLCPPGIRLPGTGRARHWLSQTYHLGLSQPENVFGTDLASGSIALVWSEAEMALTQRATDAKALHLDRSYGHLLEEAFLLVTTQAITGFTPRQKAAVFAYARRHGMRTLLEFDVAALEDGVALLADVIFMPPNKAPDSYPPPTFKALAPPQIYKAAESQWRSPRREIASLRGLSMIGFDNSDTPLVAAIRNEAEMTAGSDPIIRFGQIDNRLLSWVAISGSADREKVQQDLKDVSGRPRVVLFMDDRAVAAWSAGHGAVIDLVESVSALIFETANAYRKFFAILSRRSQSISLARRRSYLLEADPGERPQNLVDRFVRILRVVSPLRPAELYPFVSALNVPPFTPGQKRLSVCVSTYNRAEWLRVTLPLLANDIAGNPDVEFLVVDNTSTDETPNVLAELGPALGFRWVRNPENVGMLGNLAVTARLSRGDYVWILGDDDLVRPGTVDMVLGAIKSSPRAELLYLNYAYTHFDQPSDLVSPAKLIEQSTPIAPETESGLFDSISQFAANNENLFTAIYACVFRRDHAIAAYTQNTNGPAFSSLATCIPTTKYVLEHMMDRPGYWIGSHQIVVNMNVSWMRFALVWHMERLTEAMDLAEAMGANAAHLMKYRRSNVGQVAHFISGNYANDDSIRALLSMTRYIEAAKHVDSLGKYSNAIFEGYDHATNCQARRSDELPTGTIRALYGL